MGFAWKLWYAADGNRLWILAGVFGQTAGMVGMLAILNVVIKQEDPRDTDGIVVALFIMAAAAVLAGQIFGQRLAAATAESMMNGLRLRVIAGTRRLEFSEFEAIGRTRIYDALIRNGAMVSEAAMLVAPACSAIGTLVLGGIYTLLLSPVVFTTLAVLITVSVLFFQFNMRSTKASLGQAGTAEGSFMRRFAQLLDGFKETRLHRPRGDDLEDNYLTVESRELFAGRLQAARSTSQSAMFSLFFFYVMLGSVAFILPPFVEPLDVIRQSIYVAVFLLSTVETILRSVPVITRAAFALEEVEAVANDLESRDGTATLGPESATFETIQAEGLTYNYRNSAGEPVATIGPINQTIRRGDLVYCVGGNGSGKSTFMRMLCRLYPADSGTILLDGVAVTSENAGTYRALFSAVFSDFHLFDRLYGLAQLPEDQVNGLLQDLGLGGKVSYADGVFSTTELSTGQRKRLAFAVAILEGRPIMVLDELSADQDPEFRDEYYRVWLPKLKNQGRTLIVVSHDDRYFDLADRILVLRDGRIAEERKPATP